MKITQEIWKREKQKAETRPERKIMDFFDGSGGRGKEVFFNDRNLGTSHLNLSLLTTHLLNELPSKVVHVSFS